jgi:hypothetical protein
MAGLLWAALPVLVLLLLIAAAMERLLRWAFRVKRSGRSISAAGFEELNAVYQGTNRRELEQRVIEDSRRDDEGDAAPSRGDRLDLDSGRAVIRRR